MKLKAQLDRTHIQLTIQLVHHFIGFSFDLDRGWFLSGLSGAAGGILLRVLLAAPATATGVQKTVNELARRPHSVLVIFYTSTHYRP